MELSSQTPDIDISATDAHPHIESINIRQPDVKERKILEIQHPEAFHEWQAFEARMLLRGEKPRLAVFDWGGSTRIPLGVSINGRKIEGGRDGFLDDADGKPFAQYTRITDIPTGEDAGQKMLVYWTDESLLEE